MREITKCQGQDPGAVPGASNNPTSGNHEEKQASTEQRSVEIAKRLPRSGDRVEVYRDEKQSWEPGVVDNVSYAEGGHLLVKLDGETARRFYSVEGKWWRWPEVDLCPPKCKTCGVGLKDSDPKGASEGLCFPCGNRPAVGLGLQDGKPALVKVCQVTGCDTVLGDDSGETMCAPHRRQREAAGGKCARKGCVRSPMPDGIFCTGHQACAASATCDNLPAVAELYHATTKCEVHGEYLPCGGCAREDGGPGPGDIPEEEEQPNDKQPPSSPLLSPAFSEEYARQLMAEAFEFAWQKMAEDPGNDPVTVARCKMVHDFQLRELGVLS